MNTVFSKHEFLVKKKQVSIRKILVYSNEVVENVFKHSCCYCTTMNTGVRTYCTRGEHCTVL